MKRLCLPKEERDKMINALTKGEIKLSEISKLSSEERNKLFNKYVGEDLGGVVNAKFEQALVSKHKDAMVNWIKSVTTEKEPIRREMLKKVERIKEYLEPDAQHGFLRDLAEAKLGLSVTEEEAQTLIKLKETADELKLNIPEGAPVASEERLAYGFAVDKFKEYVGGMKIEARKMTPQERLRFDSLRRNFIDLAGASKSVVASLDNSFIGRQGIKTLLSGRYKLWAETAVESFKLFGKSMMEAAPEGLFKSRNDAAMAAIRADIYSRPNALNGKYKAAKNGYGLGLATEEAFPSSLPERLPLLGRVFKASETAFNGSAMKMRADLADAIIAGNEQFGIDMLDETNATAFGKLVGSMTGRGEIGRLAAVGEEINAAVFSIRFLKANIDTLTAHQLDRTMTKEAKRMAALNLLKISTHLAGIMTAMEIMRPGSVELDPRSSMFGKIKLTDNTAVDITGGMGGLATLAARGVAFLGGGPWYKNSKTGQFYIGNEQEFGDPTFMDIFWNFLEGKASPLTGMVRDFAKNKNFAGEKPTIANEFIGLVTPISAELLMDELKKGNDDLLLIMMAESLGFSATDVNIAAYGDKWKELEEKVGREETYQIQQQVTERFNQRAEKLKESYKWSKMSPKERSEELGKIKQNETRLIFKRYGI